MSKIIKLNYNPLDTIEKQIEFGFTKEEGIENLRLSEIRVLLASDVKEVIEKLHNEDRMCMMGLIDKDDLIKELGL